MTSPESPASPVSTPQQVVAHLGPTGTYAEAATLEFIRLQNWDLASTTLKPLATIADVLMAITAREADWGVVPVENSIEGGVSMTLDTLWQQDPLQVHQALELPIRHALITHATQLDRIEIVYSHPQALGQCQDWLRTHLPQADRMTTRSTTEALPQLAENPRIAAIASERAATLYNLPILACPINDYPGNITRFWLVGSQTATHGDYTSLAFSLPENVPGGLLRPLQVLADKNLNMSRIESRPTKKSAGTYVFFVDIEHPANSTTVPPEILQELRKVTETLKCLGSYAITRL